MKTGKTLVELATELQRQAGAKHDYIADTREITMLNGVELSITGAGEFGMTPLAHDQLGRHLDVPSKFYDRLQARHPQLLDTTVNTLLRAEPSQRLVRTMDGDARAFLSNRYRRLDNNELVEVVLPVLSEVPGIYFPSMEVTATRLYIKAVAPRLEAEVKRGDVVQAGVIIRNSEVGQGALSIEGMIFRLVCTNGMIAGESVRRNHVGRQIEADGSEYEIFKDDTLKADDKAFFLKVRDAVGAALTESRFRMVVDRLRDSTLTKQMEDPSHGVTELAKRFALNEGEQSNVLRHLALGGDLTQYGAIQAITRAAHDADSYDRSVDLEVIGGRVLDMAPSEWRQVATAAA